MKLAMKCCLVLVAGVAMVAVTTMRRGDDETGDPDRAPWLYRLVPAVDHPPMLTQSSGLPNTDVIVSPNDGFAQGETAVAINPAHPNIVIAGSNDFRSQSNPLSNYIYISTNGGTNWTNSRVPAVTGNYNELSDPSLTFDADGGAYYSYGAILVNQNTGANLASGVSVAHSSDGSTAWNAPVIVYASTAPNFEDKYIIAADATPTSPHKNNVYISWTHFVSSGSVQTQTIYCSHSNDKGATWSAPVSISESGAYAHLSMPAVGPQGEVYVAWHQEISTIVTDLMIAESTNGGVSFGVPHVITGQPVAAMPGELPNKGNMRMLTYPAITVDRSTSHSGRVYATWAALDGSNVQHIFLSYSDNGGATWTAGAPIDGDDVTGTDKFHPWIACDPVSGVVAVSFYDSRNDPQDKMADMYMAYSLNGGQSFTVTRVSNTSFDVSPVGGSPNQGGYWADYSGIDAYRGKIVPCWTDQRNGTSINNTEVYVSQLSLGPKGVDNLAASINPATPSTIVLSWQDPTKMETGDPLTSFTVSIEREGQYLATVQKGVQTYVDNTVQTGNYYTYQVIVVHGTDSSVVATVSAYAGGALQPSMPQFLSARETANGTELRWKNPTTHVDGTPLYDLGAVYFYVDGVRQNSGQLPSDTGKIIAHTVTATPNAYHWYSIAVVSQRQGILTASVQTDSMIGWAGAPHTTMSEGFESTPNIGTNGGWTSTTLGAHGGTHSITDNSVGRTQTRVNVFAMMPPIVVQAGAPHLSFWHVAVVSPVDSALAEYSVDHGATWVRVDRYLQSGGQFTEDVKTSTWKNIVVDMSSLVGDTTIVRFRMHSLTIHKQGWFIDDIAMTNAPLAVEPVAGLVPSSQLLLTASPNPMTVATTFAAEGITIPGNGAAVSLRVYDVTGREVADLTPALRAAGSVHVRFDAEGLPAGLYLAQLRVGSREGTARFVVQR